MNLFPLTTKKLVLGGIAGYALWEQFTFVDGVPRNTISEIVWELVDPEQYGFLPLFIFPFLFAHWFLQRVQSAKNPDRITRFLQKHRYLVVLCGLACGFLFWQRVPLSQGKTV